MSLVLGIASAACIAYPTQPLTAAITAGNAVYQQITYDNVLVFTFLICIGIIIEVMRATGAIDAYIAYIRRVIYTPFRAELATLLGAFGFFLDDYLNAFTLGAIMGPLYDTLGIPRVKLAYMINAIVPSLCIVIPATTWAAMILSQLHVAGIGDPSYVLNDPFTTYIRVIACAIYPICSIATAYYITFTRASFGLMRTHEHTHDTRANTNTQASSCHELDTTSLIEFMIPIIIFIVSSFLSFIYSGNGAIIGGTNTMLTALQNANSFFALGVSSLISACVSIIYFYTRHMITQQEIITVVRDGYVLMQGSIIVLTLAWSLSDILMGELPTASYLANLVTANLSAHFLPVIMFILSSIITASTGSAWGTIALMVPLTTQLLISMAPTALPVYLETIAYAYPTLAGVLAGVIAGGHFSPISDAMIVSSASSRASHIEHVTSHIQYSIAPLIGSITGFWLIGYIPFGYAGSTGIALAISLSITLGITTLNNRIWRA